jgi:hypothetical protein
VERNITIDVREGDITTISADVIALKFARHFYGADKKVALALSYGGINPHDFSPNVNEYSLINTQGQIRSPLALFVGVPSLPSFGYMEIRDFSKRVIEILAKEKPDISHLAMTIHGVGYGLEEGEAFLSQLAGYLDAFRLKTIPKSLERISIIEHNPSRAKRLSKILRDKLPEFKKRLESDDSQIIGSISIPIEYTKEKQIDSGSLESISAIDNVGIDSESKPHIFVAMPFSKDMDDVYFYGIQKAVNDEGYLCERVDLTSFTGDVLERVKKRIETASLVIAELSGANPNVYLEVGYAWGKNRPTVLLVKNPKELQFDVQGQRCLTYERIIDLEKALKKELNALKSQK